MRLRKGSVGDIFCSWTTGFCDKTLEVYGTQGSILIDLVGKQGGHIHIKKRSSGGARPEGWSNLGLLWKYGYQGEAEHFVNTILGKAEPQATGRDAIEAQRLAILAQQSIRTGELVRVEREGGRRHRRRHVGTGFWAKMIQLPVFDQIPDFKVIGILAREPAKARKTAERFGVPKTYETPEQLVSDSAVQIVNICAPNHLHREFALAAFEHGKDVICIKPLASNLAAAKEMVEAAEKSGRACFIQRMSILFPRSGA
jgi:predicted dehydrogenase